MVSKHDLIEKFVAVTGTDKDTASHMLEACSNDLESAVAHFLDGNVQESATMNGKPSTDDNVRAPIPQTQGVLVDDFRPAMTWRSRHNRSVFDGFVGSLSGNGTESSNDATKLQKLEELFRPPVDMMHTGSFQSARDAAVKENKWLMVNIQNVSEFACQVLNRDVWKCEKVKRLVKDHFLFWQESSDSMKGEWFMTFYAVSQWPHISVIDPRTGGRLVSFNNVTKDNIIESINSFLTDHGSRLDNDSSTSNVSSKEDLFRMNEDEQLAAAIAASLNETRFEQQSTTDSASDIEMQLNDNDSSPSKALSSNNGRKNDCSLVATDTTVHESPKRKLLQKIFPQKRKHNQPSPDPFQSSSQPKLLRESVSDEGEYYLAPDTLPCKASTNSHFEKNPSSIRLLFRHPNGKREEICLSSHSKVEDLTSIISNQYNLSSHELLKNFPRKIISNLPGDTYLDQAGVLDKDTIFIQEKL